MIKLITYSQDSHPISSGLAAAGLTIGVDAAAAGVDGGAGVARLLAPAGLLDTRLLDIGLPEAELLDAAPRTSFLTLRVDFSVLDAPSERR